MKPSAWLFAAAMSTAGLALAQTEPKSTVRETTDPASIAEIERRGQELASRGQTAPTMDAHDDKKHQGARQHKHKAKQKRAMKDKPSPDQPATDNK